MQQIDSETKNNDRVSQLASELLDELEKQGYCTLCNVIGMKTVTIYHYSNDNLYIENCTGKPPFEIIAKKEYKGE